MYADWTINFIIVSVTLVAVAASVLTHYEGLSLTSRTLARLPGAHRRVKVLYGIASVIVLHVAEIWIFGLAMWALLHWPAFGGIGPAPQHLLDVIYFSSITYTTVGYGDLAPSGAIRFISGTEALAGFVLLTWSASFTYLEMERFWRPG
jgi:type IV secretory pathway TrbD component